MKRHPSGIVIALTGLALTLSPLAKEKGPMREVIYPGDLDIDYSVPEGASRKVSPDLVFTPPTSIDVSPDRLSTLATLANPTSRPIPVVFWLGTLRLQMPVDSIVRPKPRDPSLPPLPPPVPPPPFRVVIPARTTVAFRDEVHLDEYLYAGNPEVKLEWTFHYAQDPKPSGWLRATLPARAAAAGEETRLLLDRWNALPDLFELAKRNPGKEDVYAALARLEKQHRAAKQAFRKTTVFRHLEQCSTREHRFAATEIVAAGPAGNSVETTGLAMHEAEAHGAALPAAVADFLAGLAGTGGSKGP